MALLASTRCDVTTRCIDVIRCNRFFSSFSAQWNVSLERDTHRSIEPLAILRSSRFKTVSPFTSSFLYIFLPPLPFFPFPRQTICFFHLSFFSFRVFAQSIETRSIALRVHGCDSLANVFKFKRDRSWRSSRIALNTMIRSCFRQRASLLITS